MILIADGGSTKTSWCLLTPSGQEALFETEGYHPFFVGSDYINESLENNMPEGVKEKKHRVERIFFYSAGGGYSSETDGILIEGIGSFFPSAQITIETDLLAAARALLGDREGFAAVLGTGTNSCIYDGKNVIANIESLGFLLGDEGSGSYIGKKLIGDYIREVMPDLVKHTFYHTFQLTGVELLNKVYEHPIANRYCASFAKFAGKHLQEADYYYDLVYNSFQDFFRNIVIRYPYYREYSFNCVGSVAYYFREILERIVREYGMKLGNIEKDAMNGLIAYHATKYLSI